MHATRPPSDPVFTRRELLRLGALAAGAAALPHAAWADSFSLGPDALSALGESPLVYVSPLRKDGAESTCHGEVWFVADGAEALVVTASDGWKALALKGGLDRARCWVGDHGVWKKAGGKWKESPTFLARASLEKRPDAQAKALASFGKKYPEGWGKWGPRFRDGLADESRVLIRYTPVGA